MKKPGGGAVKRSPEEHKAVFEAKLRERIANGGDPWAEERRARKMKLAWARIRAVGEKEIARVENRHSIVVPAGVPKNLADPAAAKAALSTVAVPILGKRPTLKLRGAR